MSEKTTSMNAVYEVNKVDGFDPRDFLRIYPAEVTDVEDREALDTAVRIKWFYLKYPDGQIVTEIKQLNSSMVVIEAKLYATKTAKANAFLANGHGQRIYSTQSVLSQRYVECAETAATGRALRAAGFDIITRTTSLSTE